MSTSAVGLHDPAIPAARTVAKPITRVSWFVWAGVAAVTSSSLGGAWDVAWHRSIGRDSFLTPAHLMIYACGVIAAVICSYLIFATTFGKSQAMKDVAVSVLGFRAPLGAFIAAWGGIAMLTSAPFDNWWHNAYGLDVKIISPPHTLLILGVRAVGVGVMFLILAAMNRADAAGDTGTRRSYERVFLFLGGLMVTGQMFFLMETTWAGVLHSRVAYTSMGIGLPVLFALLTRASGNRWACTITAAIFMVFRIGEILILPLVPATPKLGPVFFPVTHLVPMPFPVLLIVPAIALDLLWQRARAWKPWQIAAVSGVVFVALVFAVEWPFAEFLLTKASQNWFFGTGYYDYNMSPLSPMRMGRFEHVDTGFALWSGLVLATVYASVSTWVGLKFGDWMKGVQR